MSRAAIQSASQTELPVVRTVADLRGHVRSMRRRGESVALVPTMGALHDGHLALIRHARSRCTHVIASVFVNPKQFDRPDDLAAYPRDEASDRAQLAANGCDLLFAPGVEQMYPDTFSTSVHVGQVTEPLEGAHRPGHFAGVATVVTKLLLQSLPDVAAFGEKDYQQLITVQRLVRDLDIPVEIDGVTTVREADGLALSSRNRQLSAEARVRAAELYAVLRDSAAALATGEGASSTILAKGRARLGHAGFEAIDYLDLRAAEDLAPLTHVDRPARLLAAAWLDGVRLIDNLPVVPDAG
ncbi:pantoate--beta-alanine ligase [Rhodovibrio salinarum]|uniref:Pantothenate synthetase n=1 Tax=Rhodovibrio salinarum TaxID=1087 RepID=A0A934UZ25_9PROT|nr:pantoate--beta-alanine ligase [Rhodovibrio salinarum]MBK1695905.1 pantoate--beta-alanine ligase [Rhodovibrio salinarum]